MRYLLFDLALLLTAGVIYWPLRHWYRPRLSLLVLLLIATVIFDGWLTLTRIVQYNPSALSGWRLGPIPIEDFSYTLVAWLLVPAIFERLKSKYYG